MTRRGQERLRREVGTRTKDTTWFPFGKSILGEPLLCARRGQGSPAMLFVGVHHGMEHLTGNLLYAFLASDRLPPGTYYVVPCLNPDGAALELGGWDPASLLADRQLRMNGGSRDFSRWQQMRAGWISTTIIPRDLPHIAPLNVRSASRAAHPHDTAGNIRSPSRKRRH